MIIEMTIPLTQRSEDPGHQFTGVQPGFPEGPTDSDIHNVIQLEDQIEQQENQCRHEQQEVAGIPAKLIFMGHAFTIVPEDQANLPEVTFGFGGIEDVRQSIEDLKAYVQKNNINITNRDSFAFFNEVELLGEDSPIIVESLASGIPIDFTMLEMEMFNVKRRDITSFKQFLEAPAKASELIVAKGGLDKNKKKYLIPFTHEIKRDPLFSHPQFDLTYSMLDKSKGIKNPNEPRFLAPDGQAFVGYTGDLNIPKDTKNKEDKDDKPKKKKAKAKK